MDAKQVITSRQNPLIKSVCGLVEKKKRIQSSTFRFDGVKLLREALESEIQIKYVIYREDVGQDISALIEKAVSLGKLSQENAVAVSESVFEKMTEESSPEGVITVANMPSQLHTKELSLKREDRILIAESLRDPGNLGTVIRSCYALGIDRLIITSDCADLYNPKTIRAAMGAIFKLPTATVPCESLPQVIKELRATGRKVYAAALHRDSQNIRDVSLSRGDCFVIGNEGHGLKDSTVEACSSCVIIPMREGAESLNAAAAASICIWETVGAK